MDEPISVAPLKNSTLLTLPLEVEALAVMAMVAGAVKLLPLAGAVSAVFTVTVDCDFTVMPTGVEVAFTPALLVATAVSA